MTTDLTARRLELLKARFVGKRIVDPRNGHTGRIINAWLYYFPGRGWRHSGLRLVVKMEPCGLWIAPLHELKFLDMEPQPSQAEHDAVRDAEDAYTIALQDALADAALEFHPDETDGPEHYWLREAQQVYVLEMPTLV